MNRKLSVDNDDWEAFMEHATMQELESMILQLNKKEFNQIRYKMIRKLLSMERDNPKSYYK
jgi:hypothetical protein